jgi:hypothetical protein
MNGAPDLLWSFWRRWARLITPWGELPARWAPIWVRWPSVPWGTGSTMFIHSGGCGTVTRLTMLPAWTTAPSTPPRRLHWFNSVARSDELCACARGSATGTNVLHTRSTPGSARFSRRGACGLHCLFVVDLEPESTPGQETWNCADARCGVLPACCSSSLAARAHQRQLRAPEGRRIAFVYVVPFIL